MTTKLELLKAEKDKAYVAYWKAYEAWEKEKKKGVKE